MKKTFCVFLLIFLLLTAIPFNANAVSGVSAQKLNTFLQVGESVSIKVTFNAGKQVQAFEYTLEYDPSVLTFISASGGIYNNYQSGKVKYVNTGNAATDTVTFVFRTKAAGQTSLYITDITAADTEEYYFSPFTCNFTVDAVTRGDVNGDGKVNTTDLANLKLHLVNSSYEVTGFADYNSDSFINTTDLALLKIFLAEA